MCVFSTVRSKYLSIYLSLCFGLRGHALPQDRPEKHGHKFWSPALGELVKGPASSPCPNTSADVFYSPLRYLIYLILSYHAVGGPVFVSPYHRVGRGASYLSLIYLIAVPCQAGRYVRRLLPVLAPPTLWSRALTWTRSGSPTAAPRRRRGPRNSERRSSGAPRRRSSGARSSSSSRRPHLTTMALPQQRELLVNSRPMPPSLRRQYATSSWRASATRATSAASSTRLRECRPQRRPP